MVSIYLFLLYSILTVSDRNCRGPYTNVLLYNIRSPLAYRSKENAFCDCRVLSFPIWLIGAITLL